eukprot:CAMPEP_0201513466 /NCGR_PEP_ID=MMETSP0161_2-20130828/5511_1 /ASSEMBLY_ACC=CAM_ASM_000251 /TAXON_ID=180227 /ORGANISM="Neoparamoeba aestuarina, Strain SoJaBio B1-5/56/2" /LENGTH=273 /DNA_ID=CAMNT_0047909689 /DNA_START=185 /DNA_END=1003 /DNA_ORIENTATION=+
MDERAKVYKVIVQSVRCQSLYDADTGKFGDVSDPYAKLLTQQSGGEWKSAGKTKVIKNDLNPVWDHRFEATGEIDTIKLEIWDHDKASRDDFLGEAELNLKEVAKDKPNIPFSRPLRHGNRKQSWEPQGSVFFSVSVLLDPNDLSENAQEAYRSCSQNGFFHEVIEAQIKDVANPSSASTILELVKAGALVEPEFIYSYVKWFPEPDKAGVLTALLRKPGADPDFIPTEKNETPYRPLILACMENKLEFAKTLIEAGASTTEGDVNGVPIEEF